MIETQGQSQENNGQRSVKSVNILDILSSEGFKKEMGKIVPFSNRTERLASIARFQVKQNPTLQRCRPSTIARSVYRACELGLSLGMGGEAYLIPYGDDCQLVIGYKGLINLAARTGSLKQIDADVVRADDEFEYYKTDRVHFLHRPNFKKLDSAIELVYARAELREGGFTVTVMPVSEIKEIESVSKSKAIWTKHWNEMAKKTAIRRLIKTLPNMGWLEKFLAEDIDEKEINENYSADVEKLSKSDRIANLLGEESRAQADSCRPEVNEEVVNHDGL